MTALTKGLTPEKINKAVQAGFRKLEPARATRLQILREYAGPRYQQAGGTSTAKPINKINSAFRVICPRMASGVVRARVKTEQYLLRAPAHLFKLAIERNMNRIGFILNTLRPCVLDALCGFAVSKTARLPEGVPDGALGYQHRAGEAFTMRVSPDDYGVDPNARHRGEAVMEFDRYRMPRAFIERSGLYDQDAIRELQSSLTGFDVNQQAASLSMTVDSVLSGDDFVDYVDLVDVWLPLDKVVVTLPYGRGNTKILRLVEWKGPDEGCYDVLTYIDMPDNAIPIAQASVLLDLHFAVNEVALKQIRMSKRMKTLLGYRGDTVDEAQNILEGSDGDTVKMDDPNGAKEFKFGGPSQELMQVGAWLDSMFNEMSGNVRTAGGLGTEADTLGQEQMLAGNASIPLKDMQERTNRFAGAAMRKQAWFLHYDPLVRMPLTRRYPNGVEIPTEYSPETREGNFLDYNMEFEAYSEQQLEPSVRAGRVMQFANEVIPTALNLFQQTAGNFPINDFCRIIAQEAGIGDMESLNLDQQKMAEGMALMAATQMPGDKGTIPGQPPGAPGGPQGGPPGGAPGGSRPGGGSGGGGAKRPAHTAVKGGAAKNPNAPQLAGGARDKQTVTNGKYSARPQTGAGNLRKA